MWNHRYGGSGSGGLVAKSCLTIATPCQAPLSTGFSRKEYWSELPFPSPTDMKSQSYIWIFDLVGRGSVPQSLCYARVSCRDIYDENKNKGMISIKFRIVIISGGEKEMKPGNST